MKKCTFCGESNPDNTKICPWCGRPDTNMFSGKSLSQLIDNRTPPKIDYEKVIDITTNRNRNSSTKKIFVPIICGVVIFAIFLSINNIDKKNNGFFQDQNKNIAVPTIVTLITPTFTPIPSLTPTLVPIARILASEITMWEGPDEEIYKEIEKIYQNNEVEIIGRSKLFNWIQVKGNSGIIGWIFINSDEVNINAPLDKLPITYYRPSTKLIISPKEKGYGELVVFNNSVGDALVVMVSNDSTYSAAYIRKDETFTIQGISNGNYWVYLLIGSDWDGETFDSILLREKFVDLFDYSIIDNMYNIWEITLAHSIDGNAKIKSINEKEFPSIISNDFY